MVFTGRRLPGERYSCGCAEGPGTDHGVCSRCGQPVTIEARLRGSEVACFRIDPRELQEGMLLLQGDRFYKVLGLYPPIKKKNGTLVRYVNLKEFGQAFVDMGSYVLIHA